MVLPEHGTEQGQQEALDRLVKRCTAQARRVVTRAREEARQLQHDYLGGEHLLLALMRDGRGNGARVLTALGIDLDEVDGTIAFMVPPGDAPRTGHLPPTPRLARAFALAEEEVRRRALPTIGTEDLLLGLVREGTNVGAKFLTKFDVTEEVVRDRVSRLGPDREREPAAGVKGNVLTCRVDDRDLAVIDALVEAGIRPTRSAAAAWLIHAGIEANHTLVDKVHSALAEIRRLRDEVQHSTSP